MGLRCLRSPKNDGKVVRQVLVTVRIVHASSVLEKVTEREAYQSFCGACSTLAPRTFEESARKLSIRSRRFDEQTVTCESRAMVTSQSRNFFSIVWETNLRRGSQLFCGGVGITWKESTSAYGSGSPGASSFRSRVSLTRMLRIRVIFFNSPIVRSFLFVAQHATVHKENAHLRGGDATVSSPINPGFGFGLDSWTLASAPSQHQKTTRWKLLRSDDSNSSRSQYYSCPRLSALIDRKPLVSEC